MIAEEKSDHALVIGSGFAGLLAAQVLADHFSQVTVVERDESPATPDPRHGVPQSYHPHVLLVRGQQILEDLFPGLLSELIQEGASSRDWTGDFRWRFNGAWAPRFVSGIRSIVCSRGLLESTLRQRLMRRTNISYRSGWRVRGLIGNRMQNSVHGIEFCNSQGQPLDLPAQFIVDASGRGSRAPKWLNRLGYEAPQETSVNSFLGYATRWYRRLSNAAPDEPLIYMIPRASGQSRGAVLQKVEGDRWLVTLIGVGGDYPPTNDAEYLEFARTMEHPAIYNAIRHAEPISPIYRYRRTNNRWRHYENLTQMPCNFIALGDAVCAFNPVYGQGITVAAMGAQTLQTCLTRRSWKHKRFSRYFHKQLSKTNQTPWLIATTDDQRWPSSVGDKPDLFSRISAKYLDQIVEISKYDQHTFKRLVEVMQYTKPISHLVHPSVFSQVFRLQFALSFRMKLPLKISAPSQSKRVEI